MTEDDEKSTPSSSISKEAGYEEVTKSNLRHLHYDSKPNACSVVMSRTIIRGWLT